MIPDFEVHDAVRLGLRLFVNFSREADFSPKALKEPSPVLRKMVYQVCDCVIVLYTELISSFSRLPGHF